IQRSFRTFKFIGPYLRDLRRKASRRIRTRGIYTRKNHASSNRRDKMIKDKLKNSNLGTLLALIVLMIIVTALNPSFIYPSNLINLFRQITINGFIALGMTFVILTGGIDLSVGSILALTSALFAGFVAGGMNTFFAIVIALVLGAVMGLVNGLLIT